MSCSGARLSTLGGCIGEEMNLGITLLVQCRLAQSCPAVTARDHGAPMTAHLSGSSGLFGSGVSDRSFSISPRVLSSSSTDQLWNLA